MSDARCYLSLCSCSGNHCDHQFLDLIVLHPHSQRQAWIESIVHARLLELLQVRFLFSQGSFELYLTHSDRESLDFPSRSGALHRHRWSSRLPWGHRGSPRSSRISWGRRRLSWWSRGPSRRHDSSLVRRGHWRLIVPASSRTLGRVEMPLVLPKRGLIFVICHLDMSGPLCKRFL